MKIGVSWKPLYLLASGLLMLALFLLTSIPVHAASFELGLVDGAAAAKGVDQPSDLFGETGTFRTITNVLLFLIGAISVIMLIVGGLRYVVSGGDSTQVQNAKNTILYAIVGVIVAILAYAVISFIISSFSGGADVGGSVNGGSAAPPTNT